MKLTADVVPDMTLLACWISAAERQTFDGSVWDGQVDHSDSLDPGSNIDKSVLLLIEGYVGNIESSWGNTAEHGTGALYQHPLGREHLGLILCLDSCRSQRRVQSQLAACTSRDAAINRLSMMPFESSKPRLGQVLWNVVRYQVYIIYLLLIFPPYWCVTCIFIQRGINKGYILILIKKQTVQKSDCNATTDSEKRCDPSKRIVARLCWMMSIATYIGNDCNRPAAVEQHWCKDCWKGR